MARTRSQRNPAIGTEAVQLFGLIPHDATQSPRVPGADLVPLREVAAVTRLSPYARLDATSDAIGRFVGCNNRSALHHRDGRRHAITNEQRRKAKTLPSIPITTRSDTAAGNRPALAPPRPRRQQCPQAAQSGNPR